MIQLSHIQSKGEAHQISWWQFSLEIYRRIQDESISYVVCIIIALKKGFRNLKITSC